MSKDKPNILADYFDERGMKEQAEHTRAVARTWQRFVDAGAMVKQEPSKKTLAALRELDTDDVKKFDSVDDLFDELGDTGRGVA